MKEPFAIVNADDYYGSNAFYEIREHLTKAQAGEYAMTAYLLGNTVSKNGTVSRGVCETENGYLKKITEVTKINSNGKAVIDGKTVAFPADTPVSMNLWGLTPDIFEFIDKTPPVKSGEVYLPTAIELMSAVTNVYAYNFVGKRYDIGDKFGYLQANVEYALRTPALQNDMKEYLRRLVDKDFVL